MGPYLYPCCSLLSRTAMVRTSDCVCICHEHVIPCYINLLQQLLKYKKYQTSIRDKVYWPILNVLHYLFMYRYDKITEILFSSTCKYLKIVENNVCLKYVYSYLYNCIIFCRCLEDYIGNLCI